MRKEASLVLDEVGRVYHLYLKQDTVENPSPSPLQKQQLQSLVTFPPRLFLVPSVPPIEGQVLVPYCTEAFQSTQPFNIARKLKEKKEKFDLATLLKRLVLLFDQPPKLFRMSL